MTRRWLKPHSSSDWRALAADASPCPSRRHEGADAAHALEPKADAVDRASGATREARA